MVPVPRRGTTLKTGKLISAVIGAWFVQFYPDAHASAIGMTARVFDRVLCALRVFVGNLLLQIRPVAFFLISLKRGLTLVSTQNHPRPMSNRSG